MRRQVIALRRPGRNGAHGGGATGVSETLGQAYIRRYPEMREFLRGRVGDREVADELIQSAWVAISARADDRSIENPDAWRFLSVTARLFSIPANSCVFIHLRLKCAATALGRRCCRRARET